MVIGWSVIVSVSERIDFSVKLFRSNFSVGAFYNTPHNR